MITGVRAAMDNTDTVTEHRPRSHPAHLEWTPARMGALGAVDWFVHDCFNAFLPTSRIQRWAIVLVWESSGWPANTQWLAWTLIAEHEPVFP
jgi:hypothetical protein